MRVKNPPFFYPWKKQKVGSLRRVKMLSGHLKILFLKNQCPDGCENANSCLGAYGVTAKCKITLFPASILADLAARKIKSGG